MRDARAARGLPAGGLPFSRIGKGPPVVALQGLMFEHRALSGFEARFMLTPYRPLAEHRSFYVVDRRPGLPRDATLADMAAEYAATIRSEGDGPIDVIGVSSGRSTAFYLAAEHPDVVRRLIIQDCGRRLTEAGREWQLEAARLAEAGKWRDVTRLMMLTIQPPNVIGRAMAGSSRRSWPGAPPTTPATWSRSSGPKTSTTSPTASARSPRPRRSPVANATSSPVADLARETAADGVRGAEFERDLVRFLVEDG